MSESFLRGKQTRSDDAYSALVRRTRKPLCDDARSLELLPPRIKHSAARFDQAEFERFLSKPTVAECKTALAEMLRRLGSASEFPPGPVTGELKRSDMANTQGGEIRL